MDISTGILNKNILLTKKGKSRFLYSGFNGTEINVINK